MPKLFTVSSLIKYRQFLQIKGSILSCDFSKQPFTSRNLATQVSDSSSFPLFFFYISLLFCYFCYLFLFLLFLFCCLLQFLTDLANDYSFLITITTLHPKFPTYLLLRQCFRWRFGKFGRWTFLLENRSVILGIKSPLATNLHQFFRFDCTRLDIDL